MPSRAKIRPLAALSSLRRASAPAAPAILTAAAVGRPYSSKTSEGKDDDDVVSSSSNMPSPAPSRWYGDLHARLGKCLQFGCTPPQVATASTILGALAAEWRPLVAGNLGYLTGGGGGGRRGLEDQQVVWGEQDSFQHVNNVTYVRYAESSRVNWVLNFAHHVDPAHREAWAQLMTPQSVGLILKNIRVDFKFPLTYPDRISVYHRLAQDPAAEPESPSLHLAATVLSHRHKRVAAQVWEEVVVYDYKAARATPAMPFMRQVLADTYALQRRETRRARTRIGELTRAVAQLEKETWDRPDAVEDLGGASSNNLG